jgi:hypothetical protein
MNGSQTDKTIVVALDDFIKVLTASADRLVESPCKSDLLNKRKRRRVVIQHQLVVMFGRLRDLFDDWHPQYVAKLGFSKFRVLVRTRHWYIRSVQCENCCCLPCETHGMTRKPMTKAAETMEKLVAQMEAEDDSCDANADDDRDTASAKDKETMPLGLKDLIQLCRTKHKLESSPRRAACWGEQVPWTALIGRKVCRFSTQSIGLFTPRDHSSVRKCGRGGVPTPRTDRGRAHAQRRTCAHTHPPTHTRSHAPAQPRTREATHTRTDAATHIRSHAQTQPRTRAHTCERMADIGIGIGTAPAAGGSQARRTRGVPCGLAS